MHRSTMEVESGARMCQAHAPSIHNVKLLVADRADGLVIEPTQGVVVPVEEACVVEHEGLGVAALASRPRTAGGAVDDVRLSAVLVCLQSDCVRLWSILSTEVAPTVKFGTSHPVKLSDEAARSEAGRSLYGPWWQCISR